MMGSGFSFGIPGFGMVVFWGIIVLLVIWLVERIRFAEKQKTCTHSLHNHILPEFEG